MLPNLIVLGAQKCATTSLHVTLRQHPSITMSAVKELNFFTWHWERGPEWYAAQFDDAPVRGESTPEYTTLPGWPEVPARIAATLPDVRLVYLTRDPVQRVVSHWMHAVAAGVWEPSFAETVRRPDFATSQFAARSRYWSQVSAYLEHFDAGQLLVASLEALVADPAPVLAAVLGHVGLDPADAASLTLVRDNTGADRRRPPRVARWIRQRGGVDRPFDGVEARAYRALTSRFSSPMDRPLVTDDDRQVVSAALADDADEFARHYPDVAATW